MKYSFRKSSRMKSVKQISALFKSRSSVFAHPIKCLFKIDTQREVGKAQLLITVPKRNFKSAVERNKIKRLIRETYRLQKPALEHFLLENNLSMDIAFIYVGKEIIGFHKLESVIQRLLGHVKREALIKS